MLKEPRELSSVMTAIVQRQTGASWNFSDQKDTTTKEMLSFYFLPAFGFLRNQPSVHFYFSYYKQNKYFSHSIPCYFHPEFQQTL